MRAALLWLCVVLYPFIVYFSIGPIQQGRFAPYWLALLPVTVALIRLGKSHRKNKGQRDLTSLAMLGCAVLVLIMTWLMDGIAPLKAYPVLVNGVMLGVFGLSLKFPPSIIERLARLREPALPAEAIIYTRRVTQVWCGFFILNGSIAACTAIFAPDRIWAIYNGCISYLLMGALFLGEWCMRRRVKKQMETPHD